MFITLSLSQFATKGVGLTCLVRASYVNAIGFVLPDFMNTFGICDSTMKEPKGSHAANLD
jgi:hypothetical protein